MVHVLEECRHCNGAPLSTPGATIRRSMHAVQKNILQARNNARIVRHLRPMAVFSPHEFSSGSAMKPAYAPAKLFALQPSRCNAQLRAHAFGTRDDERTRRIDT